MKKKVILTLLSVLLFASPAIAGPTTPSGITAEDIISRVRVDINSPSAKDSFFADAEFIQWTNEAVRQIINQTRCLESGTSEIVLEENTRRYAISGTFLDIEVVEYDSGDTTSPTQIYTLDRVEKRDIGHNKEKGTPKVYCVWANSLEVWPIPRSSEAGTTLYLYKIDQPSGVTTSTSPIETPSYLDAAVLFYVKAKALNKDRPPDLGNPSLAIFDAMVKEYIINVLRRKPIGQ